MRFCDVVGYGGTVESAPGVWDDVITEIVYRGDVVRNTRRYSEGESTVNDDLSVSNSVSIVADDYALNHFFEIRYVKWAGTLWKVLNVETERPRLILRLGGVYRGPTPAAPVTP